MGKGTNDNHDQHRVFNRNPQPQTKDEVLALKEILLDKGLVLKTGKG
jgi:hypothetical protein